LPLSALFFIGTDILLYISLILLIAQFSYLYRSRSANSLLSAIGNHCRYIISILFLILCLSLGYYLTYSSSALPVYSIGGLYNFSVNSQLTKLFLVTI
jgi:hypothetical protein